jgi:hypothetical protein
MTPEQDHSRPTTLDYRTPPPPAAAGAEHLQPRAIALDIGLIFCLTLVGGFAAGLFSAAAALPVPLIVAAGIANTFFCTAGFTLSGCRAPAGNRWPHLAWVALGVWITGLFNVVIFGTPWITWSLSAIAIAVFAGLGGVFSMLLKR